MNRFKILILLLISIPAQVLGQEKLFDKAYYLYSTSSYRESLEICKKIEKKYPGYTKNYILLSQNYYNLGDTVLAKNALQKYYGITQDSSVCITLGNLSLQTKNFDETIKYYQTALAYEKDSSNIAYTKHKLQIALFRKKAYANPVPYKYKKLPSSINTSADEYFPDITADGKLFFTRKIKDENIFVSQKKDTLWEKAQELPEPVNTPQNNEGAQTVSADGKTMIFVRCLLRTGCDLYETHYEKGKWTQPVKLPAPVNTKYWETQPCLSADGNTLYFVSNRPGGKGKADIWVSTKINGKWSQPVNLGDSINSPGDEMSPFLHFDDKTLYFSSNYWPGIGGMDIFISHKTDGKWSSPHNIGYPINNTKDDVRLIVAPDGKTAYYSSASDDSGQDIYSLLLAPEIRPEPTVYLTGRILDKNSLKPIRAHIKIKQIGGNDSILLYDSTFVIPLVKKYDYSFFCSKKGYMFVSRNFSLSGKDTAKQYYHLDILMSPLGINTKTVLNNIFFETDSYKLKPESFEELDNLSRFLRTNNKIKIEVSGHTDNRGSYVYNMQLSQKRAQAVAEYLINRGIDKNRIKTAGYGYTKPVASNDTEEGRRLNRRVEIKVIGL